MGASPYRPLLTKAGCLFITFGTTSSGFRVTATLGCRLPLPATARQQGAWKVLMHVLLAVSYPLALLVVKSEIAKQL